VYKYLTGELDKLKKSIEDWTGKALTDEDLDRGIEIMDTNRRLMKQVYETRKADSPPLTGLEAMHTVVSSQMTDKRDHSSALEGVLKELPSRNLDRETGVRLMIVGSEDDDTEFVEMTESLGSTIVIDEHCTGTRYFWNEVEPQENRLAALAHRYIDRPRCPSKDWPDLTRVQHILDLAEEYNVEGALVIQQKFCDPHELDIPAVRTALEGEDIPTYFLEFDVTVPIGQFKTRVEAFLEEYLLEDALFWSDSG
jgi:benzoyl-CoA reductase subunit C